jgi:hypothetical protein
MIKRGDLNEKNFQFFISEFEMGFSGDRVCIPLLGNISRLEIAVVLYHPCLFAWIGNWLDDDYQNHRSLSQVL